MNKIKTKTRASISDENLKNAIRLAVSKTNPDIKSLIAKKKK